MNRATPPRKPPATPPWPMSSMAWIWGAFLLSILACGMVAWLHLQEQATLRLALREMDNIRQARLDLAKGFLHVSLADLPGSPFGRAEGVALLRQAMISLDLALAAQGQGSREAAEAFRQRVAAFEDRLAEWKAGGKAQADLAVALRVAFDELERQADGIDLQTQRYLGELSARLDRQFGLALGGAALLLAVLCGLVFRVGRARDRLEASLRESEDRFRQAMEATSDGLWDWDVVGGQVYYSPSYWRMLGYEAGDFPATPRSWSDLLHPEDRERAWGSAQDCIADRIPSFEMEFRMLAKDGTWHWILGRGKASLRAAGGRALRMIGTHVDITERKRNEEALRASEQRLSAILRAAADPVVVYDAEGAATFVNPAFTRVFGWRPEEVLGRPIPFVPPDQKAGSAQHVAQLYATGEPVSREAVRLTKDGELLNMLISAAGIPDQSGRIVGMVVNHSDLTQTKRLEAHLRQAQKMEAIGTLAGGIAHDFNNILGAIMGYAELARELTKEGRPPLEELAQVLASAGRARDLVRRILSFSRKAEADLRPLNLNQAVRQAVQMLGHSLPKMIAIETRLSPELWPVNADPGQLEQILLNLAGNAADAMPQGGRLTIATRNASLKGTGTPPLPGLPSGDYVTLAVSDTGTGIEPSHLEHIFDPFFTTKEVGKGTGLGLSTVYGIVKGYGGHIHCASEPGRGTTFQIFLPAHRQAAAAPVGEAAATRPAGGTETILLVDDDPSLRDLGARTLGRAGYRVRVAASGEEALAVIDASPEPIHLVVLDLGMPGMGGLRCLQELLARRPGSKVVIASGYAAENQVKDALAAGAAGFVAKPFQRSEILATVRKVLDGS